MLDCRDLLEMRGKGRDKMSAVAERKGDMKIKFTKTSTVILEIDAPSNIRMETLDYWANEGNCGKEMITISANAHGKEIETSKWMLEVLPDTNI